MSDEQKITPEQADAQAPIPPRCKHGYYVGCLRCATEETPEAQAAREVQGNSTRRLTPKGCRELTLGEIIQEGDWSRTTNHGNEFTMTACAGMDVEAGDVGNYFRPIDPVQAEVMRGISAADTVALPRPVDDSINMATTLKSILALSHKHEVQYWLDAPGTDGEKLAKITGLVWDAQEAHATLLATTKADKERIAALDGALDNAPIQRLGETTYAFVERYKFWYREGRRLALEFSTTAGAPASEVGAT